MFFVACLGMFKLTFHTKAKALVLSMTSEVMLFAVGQPIILKAEFNFEAMLYIIIFVFF